MDEELLVYFRASKIMILWAKIFNVLDVIISIASIFVTVYFFRKVALTIEGNKKNLKLKELFSKASVLVVIFVGVIFLIIFSIVSFCIAIWAFWYFEAYYIRNFGLMESIDYSLNLSDGNRIRKFLPGLIIALGILIFNIMTNIFFNILNIENFVANLIIIFIFVMILSLFVMYLQILDIIVFLNVEYDYLGENLNEELKFGIENNLNEKNQILDDNKNKNN